jgi:hypothetical protein
VLGQGWVLPWEQSLRRSGSFVYLTDNQGRSVPFVDVEPGERIYNPYEQIYLVRTQGGHYLLQTLDNVFSTSAKSPATTPPYPCSVWKMRWVITCISPARSKER